MKASEVIAVENVDAAGLADLHHQVLASANGIWQDQDTDATLVTIQRIEMRLIEGSEQVSDLDAVCIHGGRAVGKIQAKHRNAVVHGVFVRGRSVEGAIPCGGEETAERMAGGIDYVGGETCAAKPNAGAVPVGTSAPQAGPVESRCVVPENPAVPGWSDVVSCAESDVHDAV